ncbi:MAG: tol-pal system protein YbgF [Desulfobacterales bacterium]|nr:tol-pal system protein YbgF [Desulfobacterales bacterium]
MNRFFFFSVVFFFCLIFCSGCVAGNKVDTLENRILSLEMENTRQKKVINSLKKNNELSKKDYAFIKAELEKYRVTIRRLKGTIEETGHKVTTIDKKNENDAKEKEIKDLNNKILEVSKRIVELEQYTGLGGSEKVSDEISNKDVDGKDKDSDSKTEKENNKDNPEAIYKHAKNLLDKEKYDSARLEFERFINLFPDSKNADNARYWIADTYFREKWYEKAILEYQKVIEKYSTGNKVVAALLKQGFSFAELGEKANARLILKELIKKYPDSNEAGFAEKKLERLTK